MGNNTTESALQPNAELPSSFARQVDEISQKMLNGAELIKIPIVGFETMEERAKFTIFKLRVENDKLNESWLVFRRYTDFVRLHSKLKEEIPEIQISLPPKRWLRDNFETAFLEDRMKGLQALVDSILVQSYLVDLPTVRKFFCLDEPPVYSDTAEETKSWFGMMEDSSVMLKHKLQEKDQEIELLRAELALVATQRDNIIKIARNCRHCSQKPFVISASFNSTSSATPISSPMVLPSSSSSSDRGSYNNSPRKVHVGEIQLQLSPSRNGKCSASNKSNTLSSNTNSGPGPSSYHLNDNDNHNTYKQVETSSHLSENDQGHSLANNPVSTQEPFQEVSGLESNNLQDHSDSDPIF